MDDATLQQWFDRLHNGDEQAIAEAASRLVTFGEAAIPGLRAALRGETYQTCYAAAEALAQLGDPYGLPIFLMAVNSHARKSISSQAEGYFQRVNILAALAKNHVDEVIPELLEMALQRSVQGMARYCVRDALAQLEHPLVVSTLLDGLQDANRDIRYAAAWTLEPRLAEPAVHAALVEHLRTDPDEAIRQFIARVFGERKYAPAVPALIDAAKNDPDWRVRLESLFALKHIGTPEALGALQGHNVAEYVPLLRDLLNAESNGADRLFAFKMLRRIGTSESLAIREAWKTRHKTGRLRPLND
jgi:HEAT repeat protein